MSANAGRLLGGQGDGEGETVDDLQTALQLHALGHLAALIGASLTLSDSFSS